MEWGIAITGKYLMELVMLAVSSLNSESTSQVQPDEQVQSPDNCDLGKKAA